MNILYITYIYKSSFRGFTGVFYPVKKKNNVKIYSELSQRCQELFWVLKELKTIVFFIIIF